MNQCIKRVKEIYYTLIEKTEHIFNRWAKTVMFGSECTSDLNRVTIAINMKVQNTYSVSTLIELDDVHSIETNAAPTTQYGNEWFY